jgi:hypothetical protein
MQKYSIFITFMSAFLLLAVHGVIESQPMPTPFEQIPRMTKEQLKGMLGKPDLVVFDVRFIKQYEQSDKKLPGAVFIDSENMAKVISESPLDRTYVFYCA